MLKLNMPWPDQDLIPPQFREQGQRAGGVMNQELPRMFPLDDEGDLTSMPKMRYTNQELQQVI
jgi:hypothetical protein